MLKEKMIDLVNSTFTNFRLAPIMRIKSVEKLIKGDEDCVETLSLSEGINIEKKSKNYDSYFVIGTIRRNKDEFEYEDCGFRTFDEVSADEFIDLKNIIEYAKILLELFKDRNNENY